MPIMNINAAGSKYMGALIHVIIWTVVLVLPFLASSQLGSEATWGEYARHLTVVSSFAFTFYLNYFLLIKKYLLTHRVFLFIVYNILLISIVMTATHLTFHYLLPQPDRPAPPMPFHDGILFVTRNATMYIMVAGAAVAIRVTEGWYAAETERRELERSRTEAELQNLKSQLNPHLLFNTLNNIYSLIGLDTDMARKAVHDLSHMLRYVLYESSRPFVPLSAEMAFLREYVGLMKIRLPKNTRLSVSLPGEGLDRTVNPYGTDTTEHDPAIAPLLFITLVENAFKHGISDGRDSFVDISISLKEKTLVCDIRNSCFPKSPVSDRSGSGIGIANLKKRLEMIYPGKFVLEYGRHGNEYTVHLSIDTE